MLSWFGLIFKIEYTYFIAIHFLRQMMVQELL